MARSSTISSKGQITVPLEIRKRLPVQRLGSVLLGKEISQRHLRCRQVDIRENLRRLTVSGRASLNANDLTWLNGSDTRKASGQKLQEVM